MRCQHSEAYTLGLMQSRGAEALGVQGAESGHGLLPKLFLRGKGDAEAPSKSEMQSRKSKERLCMVLSALKAASLGQA